MTMKSSFMGLAKHHGAARRHVGCIL